MSEKIKKWEYIFFPGNAIGLSLQLFANFTVTSFELYLRFISTLHLWSLGVGLLTAIVWIMEMPHNNEQETM